MNSSLGVTLGLGPRSAIDGASPADWSFSKDVKLQDEPLDLTPSESQQATLNGGPLADKILDLTGSCDSAEVAEKNC